MKDAMSIDNFIQLLHDTLLRKSDLIDDDVKIRIRIKDHLWSAIFLLEFNEVSIGVSKNGITYSYPEFNEEGEEPVCTIKEMLEHEIADGKITILELERLILEAI